VVGVVPLRPIPPSMSPMSVPSTSASTSTPTSETGEPRPPRFLDLDSPQAAEVIRLAIQEALARLGVRDVACTGYRGPRAVNRRKDMGKAIKLQQACISKEADQWWKVYKRILQFDDSG
jgi:hypothetical protein